MNLNQLVQPSAPKSPMWHLSEQGIVEDSHPVEGSNPFCSIFFVASGSRTLPEFNSVGVTFKVLNAELPLSPGFSVIGTNLLDEVVPHFGFPAVTGDERVYILGRPRTLLASLELSF